MQSNENLITFLYFIEPKEYTQPSNRSLSQLLN